MVMKNIRKVSHSQILTHLGVLANTHSQYLCKYVELENCQIHTACHYLEVKGPQNLLVSDTCSMKEDPSEPLQREFPVLRLASVIVPLEPFVKLFMPSTVLANKMFALNRIVLCCIEGFFDAP